MKRLFLATLVLLQSSLVIAQVPNLLNYQGRVAVGTVNFEGTGQFRFALVNTAGTTVYWSSAADTAPADGVPDAAVSLPVSKGLYSVLLGDTSFAGMAAIPASVWTNADVRLRVWFNDGTNGNQLLTPDQRLAPNGYLPDGSVAAAALATNAVTSAKIAASAVTNAKLASGIDASKITIGTFPALSGSNLTGLTAGNITSGTLPDARLSNNVPRLDAGGNLFLGTPNGTFTPHIQTLYLGSQRKYLTSTLATPVEGSNDWINLMGHPFAAGIMFGTSGPSDADPHSAPTPLMVIRNSGNVGIGTTSPATALHVAGTVTATAFSGDLTGNVTGSAASFTGPLAGDVTGTQSATNISAATVTGKALTGFSSDAGTVAASDTILSAINKLDGNVALKAPLASPTFTGNVGIGTTAPAAKLHIFGTGFGSPANSGSAQSPGLVARLRDGGNILLDIGGSGGGGFWLQCTDGGNLASNFPLTLNPNGGNVGIGTNNANATLDVSGGVKASGNNGYTFNSGDEDGGVFSPANGVITLRTENAERLRVDANGRVGIGTSSPTSNLSIATTSDDATATAKLSLIANGGHEWVMQSVTGFGGQSPAGGFQLIDTATSITAMTVLGDGKVGIGTTSPVSKLHVDGTVTATAFSGDGSGLTGVVATGTGRTPQQIALLKWGVSSANNTFAAGSGPYGVCFDGASIWVANYFSNNVTKLNASTGAVIGTYAVGTFPTAICFDGASIWVANGFGDNVTKLNASTGAVIGTYAVGVYPIAICFDGASIWVANYGGASMTKLNASNGDVIGTYNVGDGPHAVCFDGASIWVANGNSNNVTKLNASTGAVIGTYPLGSGPEGICFDGASIWVANEGSDNVTKLNASTGAVIGTYNVGDGPHAVCFDGASIWVANGNSNNVTKLNASTGDVIGTYNVGDGPRAVCFDGASIWVANEGSNNVTKL